MNKKNLSVVMAGAMLATSVAPVLADATTENTYEVTAGKVGLLIDRLDTYFATCEKFSEKDYATKSDKEGTVIDKDTLSALAGKPVYAFEYKEKGSSQWLGTIANASGNADGTGTTDTSVLKSLDSTKTYEIRVIDRGHRTNAAGEVVSTTDETYKKVPNMVDTTEKYTAEQIVALAQAAFKAKSDLTTIDISDETIPGGSTLKTLFAGNKITDVETPTGGSGTDYESINDVGSDSELNSITKLKLKTTGGEIELDSASTTLFDFSKPKKSDDNITGFETLQVQNGEKVVVDKDAADIASTVEYNVNLVPGDTKVDYKVTDLYDGFMLTDAGHALLTEINTVNKKDKEEGNKGADDKYSVTISNKGLDVLNNKFTVTIVNKGDSKVVTVTGTDKEVDKLNTLKDWLEQGYATVDILAGDNRYATAVEIAKTYAASNGEITPDGGATDTTNHEIVLVNGEALVDGLAAAPYAKSKNAPILLTASDKLSKETKEYLKEIIKGDTTVGELGEITVTIIGGEAVVSQNVVDELREIGFSVKRIAGDNREETSLAVANKIKGNDKSDAFVVGANGEADAMSIAPYAAADATPIIVSKSAKGLSTSAMTKLSGYQNVTIIGGTVAVSESDEAALKDSIGEDNVERIAGAKRQDTNAEIIKKYSKNSTVTDVLVAKDGMNNKSELVDALSVSIFAAADDTVRPIVLATNNLTDEQLNQVVLKTNKNTAKTVYQVGYGVNRTVMEKIVTKLGLNK